jgi:hypothetical protein
MTTEPDEAVTLSAQYLEAQPTRVDGMWILRLSDGEQTVEITPEIGDPDVAARHLDALAMAAGQCAEQIRRYGRARLLRP